jgi:hypothetical protein
VTESVPVFWVWVHPAPATQLSTVHGSPSLHASGPARSHDARVVVVVIGSARVELARVLVVVVVGRDVLVEEEVATLVEVVVVVALLLVVEVEDVVVAR